MARAHGEIRIDVEGRLVIATYIGNINVDCAAPRLEKLREEIERFNQEPFVMLVDDLLVEGATPEAFEALEQFNQWVNQQQMLAKAMLIKSTVMLKIIDQRVSARKQQNIESFTDRDEAIAWLLSHLP